LPEIVQDIGAYAGIASVVGLAVLSVLYFSQARDVKRLREWAGRAPERAEEGVAAAQPVPGRVVAQPQQKPAATPAPAPAVPAAAGAAPAAAGAAAGGATATGQSKHGAGEAVPAPGAQPAAVAAAAGNPPAAAGAQAAPAPSKPGGKPAAPEAKPAPEAQPAAPAAPPGAPAAPPGAPAAQPAAPAAQPGAPAAQPAPGGPARPAAPPVPGAPRPAGPAAARPGVRPAPQTTAVIPPKRGAWHQRLFGSTRNLILAVGGVLLLGAGVALALTQLSEEEPTTPTTPQAQQPVENGREEERQNGERRRRRPAIDPSSVTVAVLNGTTVPGLAARVSDEVQSAGFEVGTVANSSEQQRAESVILFAPGHEREAAAVSRRLDIAQREPIDAATQGLAGDATVVVVTGADRS
jgi:hypothetical protein